MGLRLGGLEPITLGRETALRRDDAFGACRERADVAGRRHVFGEVEIVGAERVARRCDGLVESVGQAGQHSLLAPERRPNRCGVGEIRMANGERRVGNRARIEARHRESGVGQELRGEMTDLAEPKDRDCRERHLSPSVGQERLRFAPRRIRRRLNLVNPLGAKSCNSVSSEWRSGGGRSRRLKAAGRALASLGPALPGALFPGAESVFSRRCDSISSGM